MRACMRACMQGTGRTPRCFCGLTCIAMRTVETSLKCAVRMDSEPQFCMHHRVHFTIVDMLTCCDVADRVTNPPMCRLYVYTCRVLYPACVSGGWYTAQPLSDMAPRQTSHHDGVCGRRHNQGIWTLIPARQSTSSGTAIVDAVFWCALYKLQSSKVTLILQDDAYRAVRSPSRSVAYLHSSVIGS